MGNYVHFYSSHALCNFDFPSSFGKNLFLVKTVNQRFTNFKVK